MKTDSILKRLIMCAMVFAAAAALSSALITEVNAYEGSPAYNVVPRMPWTLGKNHSGLYSFTFGSGVYPFRFDPVDVSRMDFLEFDVYLSDPDVVDRWKTGETEFEITSSGTCDMSEYAWSGYALWEQASRNGLELREGWNHVKLNLPKNSPADLSKINYIRWYWNEDDENKKISGCRVANLKFTVRNGRDPENAYLSPFIPFTVFETEDVPVALANVTWDPYNADPTGEKDSTKAIQDALDDVSMNGGGTVWMPAGTYRITEKIRIPAYVTLRGDWTDPASSAGYGTLIALDIPENDRNDTGTIILGGAGGVYGLTVFYPNQSLDDVKAYPFAFYVEDHVSDSYLMPSVINCTVLNGYRGIGAATKDPAHPETDDNGHENMYVLNYRGTFLENGAESCYETDFGFWDDVKISSKYWADASRAGVLPPVDENRLKQYTKEHASGLILGDLDWVSLNNISVESCSVGVHTVHGKRNYTDFQGLMYGVTTKDCGRGVVIDALHEDIGLVLANSNIEGGLYNTTKTVVRLFNVRVSGVKDGWFREDEDFTLQLPVPDSDFGYTKPKAILYTADLDAGGTQDISAELQKILDRAGTTGGVVYLPGGIYRMDAPVIVPAGVELKGTSAVPTRDFPFGYVYNGTTLLSYYLGSGPEDQALITLSGEGAGVNGLRINFPENRIRKGLFERDLYSTAYAVKGTAPGVYIVNSFIVSSAYGVDFTGCDHHLVKNLSVCSYSNALKLGGKGGMVSNTYQNPGGPFISSTPFVVLPQGDAYSLYGIVSRDHTDFLILEYAEDELIWNAAMFGPHRMLENRSGRNTTVINLSSDYLKEVQMIMDGGSMTVVNAVRWDGKSFLHKKGILRIYNRFEHGFSSKLHGDAIEESYVAWK